MVNLVLLALTILHITTDNQYGEPLTPWLVKTNGEAGHILGCQENFPAPLWAGGQDLERESLGPAQKATLPNHPEKGNHKQKSNFAVYRGTPSPTGSR